jgi:PatG C-terminal
MSEQGSVEQPANPTFEPIVRTTTAAQAPLPNCPTCGDGASAAAPPSYVYAVGRIEPRFPLLSVEKEFAQVVGRTQSSGLTDRQALHQVLTRRENRFLARQLCWMMTVEGIETYILVPRDPADLDLLIEALRATPSTADVDVVIGVLGPIAPPALCNGLMVPIVIYDQIYSFDRGGLIGSIPRPDGVDSARFQATADEVFDRVTQMTDNAGATDAHRALNYLAVRYPGMYATVLDAHDRNLSVSAVEVRPSTLSATRRIVEVILSFTNRATDVTEKYFVRVDVTEQFPFLVTKMSPYFDR